MKAATGKTNAALMVDIVLEGRMVDQEATEGIVIEALWLPL